MHGVESYEIFLRIADEDDVCVYLVEHWFVDRPDIETTAALFEEAKRDFARLYPEVIASDFSVEVRRLRPDDRRDDAPERAAR